MKKVLLSLFFAFIIFSCRKSTEKNCTNVIVTLKAPSCKGVGVIIDGIKYPTDDLPAQYAVEGKKICIEYSFWEDPTMCQCCGGKKVHIIAVH
ncbi:MAG TPA: hypothetical protein VLI68_09640 [Hanamia sp.]|jgi:hypothetical protein|nr:hypothetical protein [Hanamia sp.]